MSSQNHLEINGNLLQHPLAELLVEISQARIDGSLRLSHHTNKTIIYVRGGEIVFAVSNQRQHRIFEMLLEAGSIVNRDEELVMGTDEHRSVIAGAVTEAVVQFCMAKPAKTQRASAQR